MSTFDYIAVPLNDLDSYKAFMEGVDLFIEEMDRDELNTAQSQYDNRVKATMVTGLMETNTLLLDIALSLRVLSGRDK